MPELLWSRSPIPGIAVAVAPFAAGKRCLQLLRLAGFLVTKLDPEEQSSYVLSPAGEE